MEYIDIFDENNNTIGEIKKKQQAHEDDVTVFLDKMLKEMEEN